MLHFVRKIRSYQTLSTLAEKIQDICIIGSGPAGYTAALYAARANRSPVVIAGYQHGGQLMLTSDVENFPGYPNPISGPDLMEDLRKQAERFGASIIYRDANSINIMEDFFVVNMRGINQVRAKSIVISTGAEACWLHAKNEELVRGSGVSTCATCDGAFYEGQHVLMVGGGDSAMTEALFLTRFASKVTIIHRRKDFRASKIMVQRVLEHPKIEIFTDKVVTKWLVEDGKFSGAELRDVHSSEITQISASGGFIAIGHRPNTHFLKGTNIELDCDGYIVTKKHTMTSIDGIFACGDVVDKRYRQAITAAGMGCQAAMDVEHWLEEIQWKQKVNK